MGCTPINIGGIRGIVCERRRRPPLCKCGSGLRVSRECDWKMPQKKSGTCDAKLCDRCTHVPAHEKDLCPTHAKAWEEMKRRKQQR